MKTYQIELGPFDLFRFFTFAGHRPELLLSLFSDNPTPYVRGLEQRISYDGSLNPFLAFKHGYTRKKERELIENQPLLDNVQHLVEEFFQQTKRGGGRAWVTYKGLIMQHSGNKDDHHLLVEWLRPGVGYEGEDENELACEEG